MADGQIDHFSGPYQFLSNFYAAQVGYEGVEYQTVEHAYQASKTLNLHQRRFIADSRKPGIAKIRGRNVTLRPDWEQLKLGIMEVLVLQKFTRYPDLREKLLRTGDLELVEGNNWNDTFWGVVKQADGSETGLNHLGLILMNVRQQLRRTDEERGHRKAPEGKAG